MSTCSTCRYWNGPGFGLQMNEGECRRRAPLPGMQWPTTEPSAWCGEWEDDPQQTQREAVAVETDLRKRLSKPVPPKPVGFEMVVRGDAEVGNDA